MRIQLKERPGFQFPLKFRPIISDTAAYLLLALFMYTAASKILTINAFSSTLAKSPIIGSYSLFVAWLIPISEIVISLLLIIAGTRKLGLYASLALLGIFTIYLVYMVSSGTKLPCHCGGAISTMTWQQHIWFNAAFLLIAAIGIRSYKK
ncbi:MAG TPA: MauE/DoxX family redox-associated membrane protein [Pedobacter sp.]|uniref:MauE/DoxX family redox-associated membrane protein n=1 Tax=Pedobacter sp. TaxID=1411316 RepID=UPI002D12C05F|nr:MauE/DoxX family redox-associated membrane protein [Pedobacter sp.]HMI02175.1 MauE/DoxX family redox-associated membrane protein [Pedobacter sp.]